MVQGGVVLSTCNRTELYLSVEERDDLQEALIRWLCDYHNLNEDDLRNSLYWHQDNDAVSHLMTCCQRPGFTGSGGAADPRSG